MGNDQKKCKVVLKDAKIAIWCFRVLELSKSNQDGREVIIRYVCARELTAGLALLKGTVYPVTAEAVKKTAVVAWDKKAFTALMHKCPQITMTLFAID